VISCDGDRTRIKFGYSRNIKASLEALSEANWQRLLVRKIVPASSGADILDEMIRPFDEHRLRAYWYRLDTTLRTMLRDFSDATTYELEGQLLSAAIAFDVIANPHEPSPYRTREMVNRIKRCRHYIL